MRAASEIQSRGYSIKRKIEKLCLDDRMDRERFEEIANNPLCEIVDRQYNSTNKGLLWVTIEYDTKDNPVIGPKPIASQAPGGLEDGNRKEHW